MKFCVFDTETTGLLLPSSVDLVKQPHVIEFAMVQTDGRNVFDSCCWFVRPPVEIPADATKVNGITNDQVRDQVPFAERFEELQYCLDADAVVAHNLPFDKTMLDNEAARIGKKLRWPELQICTVQEYAPLFGKRPTLKDLYAFFTGKKLEQKHRALDDVEALVEALQAAKFFEEVAAS